MIALSLLLVAGAVALLVVGVWQASNLLLGISIGLSLLAAIGLIAAARQGVAGSGPPVTARDGFGAGGWVPAARRSSRPPATAPPPPAAPPPSASVALPVESAPVQPAGGTTTVAPPATDPPATDRPATDRPATDRPATDRLVADPPDPDPLGLDPPGADPLGPGTPAGPGEAAAAAGTVTVPAAREPAAGITAEPVPASEDASPVGAARDDPPDEPEAQQVSAGDAARVAQLSADVLVVDGRPRYHQPGCVSLLGRESERLPVNEAVELGFTPCGLCEPDSALLADARRV